MKDKLREWKGRITEKGVRIAAILLVLCIGLGCGGYVYAKYFSESARWGVAIASGVYFTANYASQNEEYFESVVKSDYVGSNYEFAFEVRNYENNLLFNESGVEIHYSLSFWLGKDPGNATYYIAWGQEQPQIIGVGEENKLTIDGQVIAGGSAIDNEYTVKIIPTSEELHEAVPIYVEVQTDENAIISKVLRGKMVLNNTEQPENYIKSQGFLVSDEMADAAQKYAELMQMSGFTYEIITEGEVATDEITEELKLSWNPLVLEIDLFDDAFLEWCERASQTAPETDEKGWKYITLEVMPYSAQTVGFFRGEDFDTIAVDMESLNASIIAEKYQADSGETE